MTFDCTQNRSQLASERMCFHIIANYAYDKIHQSFFKYMYRYFKTRCNFVISKAV